MSDLLVRLYDLPPLAPVVDALDRQEIDVRRALAHERPQVTAFARAHGSEGWAAECDAAFARLPLACFVAVERGIETSAVLGSRVGDALIGFACYEATCRDFFGPELVDERYRGRGVGKALLLAALHAMRAEGYAYAIIGWASSVDFYRKAVGATVIDGSRPGIYPPPLKG
ncbi:MAG TPA: GNAT family N-acetyltransferase [Polyangia bacterium]|jgi:GNAT superfamily N-acetyltransferase